MSTEIQSPLLSRTAFNPAVSHQRLVQPKFGYAGPVKATVGNLKLGTSARALGMSEKVVETFLWSFVGLDVLGMWLPRINVSLNRGSIPYDVRQDPDMQGKPLHQQVIKSIQENIKGLNWTNFYEEAGREFATGPGMLVVPTLVYLLVGRARGGQAVRMASQHLTEHGAEFAKHLKPVDASHVLNQSRFPSAASRHSFLGAYRDQVKQYLVHALKDDDFYKFRTGGILKEYRAGLPVDKREKLNALLPIEKVGTGKEYLDQWFGLWSERHVHPGKVSAKADRWGREEMRAAYDELYDLMNDKFNEDYVIGKNLDLAAEGKLRGSTGVMTAGDFAILGSKRSLAEFLGGKSTQGELEKLGSFFSAIAGERLAGKPGHISDMATGIMQKTGALKTVQYAAALLSGLYVAALVKFTQKHDSYPGERLMHLATSDDQGTHTEKHDRREHQKAVRMAYSPPIFAHEPGSPFKLPDGKVTP